jgi:aminoglycoside phosphotransferase
MAIPKFLEYLTKLHISDSWRGPKFNAILPAHLVCEYFLDEIIIRGLKNGEEIVGNEKKRSKLSFSQKFLVVSGVFDIDDGVVKGIKLLNDLRNSIAHRPFHEVSDDKAKEIAEVVLEEEYEEFLEHTVGFLFEWTIYRILFELNRIHKNIIPMDIEKKIKQTIKEELSEDVVDITDSSNGIEQNVYIVQTCKNKYIAKFPKKGNEIMIFREEFACNNLKQFDFLPKLIYVNDNFLIESFLEGESLWHKKRKNEVSKSFWKDFGRAVSKIHTVKIDGYGEITEKGKGKFESWEEFLEGFLSASYTITALRKTELLNEEEIQDILDFITKNSSLGTENEMCLLHFDLIEGNVLLKDNEFASIIDFGDISSGAREFDLGKLYLEEKGQNFDNFLIGYGKKSIDIEKVHYFAVLHLLYVIPHFFGRKDIKKCKEMIEILKEISL